MAINDLSEIVGEGFSATPLTTATPQTITFGPLSSHTLGSGSFTLTATTNSGLTVTFASNSTTVCTVSGVTVTLPAAGTCSIAAGQPGNSTYGPAAPVTQTFTVTQAITTTSPTSSPNPSIPRAERDADGDSDALGGDGSGDLQ